MQTIREHMNLDEEARLVLRAHINAALAALPPGATIDSQNKVLARVAIGLAMPIRDSQPLALAYRELLTADASLGVNPQRTEAINAVRAALGEAAAEEARQHWIRSEVAR